MKLAQVNIPYGQINGSGIDLKTFRFQTSGDLVGDVISRLLLFAIVGAGLLFFVKLLMAGYGYLTSAGDAGKIQTATKSVTNAAIGLVLVITSFFITQIIETLLGVNLI